ncbi:hypothetical protein GJ654_12700 [Rhodoblastus acidophilus]|uniref:Uncharacterized protein n=1 Tax=Rhodoblastus acidophilus TaxID=1074 RepID=A0A6N8DQL9_RHOAC|nr:hypothetical protein [Rhodoblastus acidophilus]MTV31845.1 hypothetical protein [Rhodoblastus acidophilus]
MSVIRTPDRREIARTEQGSLSYGVAAVRLNAIAWPCRNQGRRDHHGRMSRASGFADDSLERNGLRVARLSTPMERPMPSLIWISNQRL